MGFAEDITKFIPVKVRVKRFNLFLVFLFLFVVIYASLLLRSPSMYKETIAPSVVNCSLQECQFLQAEESIKMKAILEKKIHKRKMEKEEIIPDFVHELGRQIRLGMVNMDAYDKMVSWDAIKSKTHISFDRVSPNLEWNDLFPEWIDEEEIIDAPPSCPEIPMPDFERYEDMDVIFVNLPCSTISGGGDRNVFRLQVHLIASNLIVKKGKIDEAGRVRVVLWSKCRPMIEFFRCDDLVRREGDWWWFQLEVERLKTKTSLPIGSCKLALPVWEEGNNKAFDPSKLKLPGNKQRGGGGRREAFVTVLHSSEKYVCGALVLAQSLIRTGTTRDLLLLLDKSISRSAHLALVTAGWKLRTIKRIRNPHAENDTYNEYNYSKFRLWQITDYDKLVFIDSDIIVLRNLDMLFEYPEMSATGNDGFIFNSGVMVIEPSKCTFQILMNMRMKILSSNGGDQGFLNEIFIWWHRLPRRVNFLKNFWANTTIEAKLKNRLFAADPPELYAIHYLGLKPWKCYRDYDCNWNIENQRVYASDVAHERWWKLHDTMDLKLQNFCGLTQRRDIELRWERRLAEQIGFVDGHWRINITDPRRHASM